MIATFVLSDLRSSESKVLSSELPVTIGRGPEADIRLVDSWVSRRHCQIDEVEGSLVVRDLSSKHGTMVNRHPITESMLLPGDEILVGLTSLRASVEDSESSDCWANEPAFV